MNIFKLFRPFRKAEEIKPKIVFGAAAARYGFHGIVRATSKEHNLVNAEVAFVYVGCTEGPGINSKTLLEIERAGARAGYLILELVRYNAVIQPARNKSPAVTTSLVLTSRQTENALISNLGKVGAL